MKSQRNGLEENLQVLEVSRRGALRYAAGGAAGFLWALVSGVAIVPLAQAKPKNEFRSVETLKRFLQDVKSLRAVFKQVVTSPQTDKEKSRVQESSGTFILVRPNQFRFDYTAPYQQQIISDGKTLWLYDVDLEQVTEKSYSEAMGSTPAALLAGGAEATMTQENFVLTAMPDAAGVEWVKAVPKQEDGQIRYAEIGFKNGMLNTLVIVDNFGQKSTLTFSGIEVNPDIPREVFAFKVPDGVDVIAQ